MRLRRLAALVLALCLALGRAGCAGETREVTVWRSGAGSVALPETKRLAPGTGLIPGAVAAFNSTPDEPGLERAAPEGADILGWRLEGSELKLEVSPEWAELSGFEKTVAECCAALSFCALEGVERVSFYLLGQRLGRSIDEGDIILSAYAEEE